MQRMNLSNITTVQLDNFCANITYRSIINNTGTDCLITNLTCLPRYTNLWFKYNDSSSYYRTLIPSVSMYDNLTFYMINLQTNIAVLWDVFIDDLSGDYTATQFYVTKNTQQNGTVEVIRQILDLENKAHLYLIKDETYNFNIVSVAGGATRIIGAVLATAAAAKVITLPNIDYDFTQEYGSGISYGATVNLTSHVLRVVFDDSNDQSQWVQIQIHNGTTGALIVSYNTTSHNLTYAMHANGNESYTVTWDFKTMAYGHVTTRRTVGAKEPGLDLTWLYAGDDPRLPLLKHGISVGTMVGTALIFPAEFVIGGIVLILIEIFAFSAWGWLGWGTGAVAVIGAILGIEAVRLAMSMRK
jgi:hypothetical protein